MLYAYREKSSMRTVAVLFVVLLYTAGLHSSARKL